MNVATWHKTIYPYVRIKNLKKIGGDKKIGKKFDLFNIFLICHVVTLVIINWSLVAS
jgi:hypothetical protein